MIIAKPRPAIRKFQLPKNTKVYLIFNVSLFHPASPDTPAQSTFQYKLKKKTNSNFSDL